MTNILTLSQGIAIMKSLLKEEEYGKALAFGEKLYDEYPESWRAARLFRKAIRKYDQQRKRIVDEGIKNLNYLWETQSYSELIKAYEKLAQVYPEHDKLNGLINKVRKIIAQKERREFIDYLNRSMETIKRLTDEQKFNQAIQACIQLLKTDPENEDIQEILNDLRIKFVNQQLDLAKVFLSRRDFRKLLKFYRELEKVAPDYKKLKKLILDVQEKIDKQEKLDEQEKISELLNNAQEYFEQQNVKQALDILNKVLNLDLNNPRAKKLQKKILLIQKQKRELELLQEMVTEKERFKKGKGDQDIVEI